MPFATRPRLFRSRLLVLLAFTGLGSGCQSSRPSFSFQPVPGRVQPRAVSPLVAAAAEDGALAPVASSLVPVGTLPVRKQHRVLLQPQRPPALVTAENIANASIPLVRRAAVHRRALLGRPQATAEMGLGTTVLGVLGLVVLPIALIGLAISGGGLVWAIVAGAAALAVLVAYVDPFGR